MHWFDLSGFKLTVFSVLDIFLLAIIIYQLYNLIRGTIAANIFIGLALIYILYFIVPESKMPLLAGILKKVADVGIIAVIILFQQEIRRFLLLVGKNASLQRNKAWWRYFFGKSEAEKDNYARIKPIIDACKSLKQTRTGALMFSLNITMNNFIRTVAKYWILKYQSACSKAYFKRTAPCMTAQ